MRTRAVSLFSNLQKTICQALENIDGKSRFVQDVWNRQDPTQVHAGGGITRVLTNGRVFEKAGVNFSEVFGKLPVEMCQKLVGENTCLDFFASGISLVLHPESPMIPTTHANFRYLEVGNFSWFGGGTDLTPYYLYSEDAKHFHSCIKNICDQHNQDYYPRFKKWCDEYFYLPHRKETRGVGGIFFDYLGKNAPAEMDKHFLFVEEMSSNLLDFYLPIVIKRQDEAYGEREKYFQLLRRGRYVEFNLIYDRGTHFGLQTNGRTESILMSLPPQVRWDYDVSFPVGSREADLLTTLSQPREWV